MATPPQRILLAKLAEYVKRCILHLLLLLLFSLRPVVACHSTGRRAASQNNNGGCGLCLLGPPYPQNRQLWHILPRNAPHHPSPKHQRRTRRHKFFHQRISAEQRRHLLSNTTDLIYLIFIINKMAGGKGKSGGKSSGGKTGADGSKKQQSHSQKAGLQVSIPELSFWRVMQAFTELFGQEMRSKGPTVPRLSRQALEP